MTKKLVLNVGPFLPTHPPPFTPPPTTHIFSLFADLMTAQGQESGYLVGKR